MHGPGHQVIPVPDLQAVVVGTRGEQGVVVYTNA